MTNQNQDLPSWKYAMGRAARHLAEFEARIAKRPASAGMEDLARLSEAWVSYARELTNHAAAESDATG